MLYTFPHELDYEVGRKIVQAVPGIDRLRFANSGSEATQAAIRLARAYTGKDKVMKWEGSYNGFLDCSRVSRTCRRSRRRAREVPAHAAVAAPASPRRSSRPRGRRAASTISTPSRCSSSVTATSSPACSPSRSSATPASSRRCRAFSRACAASATRTVCVLIFDEIITGFRVSLGGAQELYGVTPDITCIAKAVGGGTPGAAAFGGKKEHHGSSRPTAWCCTAAPTAATP